MKRLPIKLTTDPIVEAVFELRFVPAQVAGADLLLGSLFAPMKDRFPTLTRLPTGDLPEALLKLEPNLRFQPRIRLTGTRFSLLLGDYSLMVAASCPYAGWSMYQAVISEAISLAKESGVVKSVERFSIKYINLLPAETVRAQFGKTLFNSQLGGRDLLTNLTTTKTEFDEDGFTNIVELAPQSTTEIDGKKITGLLVNVDTIATKVADFWNNCDAQIARAHTVEKRIFFSILTPETIRAYGAVYSEVTP